MRSRTRTILTLSAWAIALAASSARPARAEEPCPPSAVYGPDEQQVLDFYPASGQKAPILVFLHGGAWRTGRRTELESFARALADQGVLMVVPDYRTAPEHPFPAQIEDVAAAVRWVLDHAGPCGGDATRLYLGGHSAGGHLAALLAVDPRWRARVNLEADEVRGVVTVGGVFRIESVEGGFPSAIVESVFGPDRVSWLEASPLELVARRPEAVGTARWLLLVGEDEPELTRLESRRFAEALDAAGSAVTRIEIPGTGHAGALEVLSDPASPANAALHELLDPTGSAPAR